MKIREGFVSNSSSSSFIIGAGKIKDIQKFMSWMRKNELSAEGSFYEKDINIVTTSYLLENQNGWDHGIKDRQILYVTGCINYEPQVTTQFNSSKEEYYCIVNVGNDEGDSIFWNNQTEKMDYDINENYFHGKQSKVIEMLKGDLLENCNWEIGVGRNG